MTLYYIQSIKLKYKYKYKYISYFMDLYIKFKYINQLKNKNIKRLIY